MTPNTRRYISPSEALNTAIRNAKNVKIPENNSSASFASKWRPSVTRESGSQSAPLCPLVEPPNVPQRSGKDATTVVDISRVFDLDRALNDLADFLVNRIVEDSLLSVVEEDTLAKLRARREAVVSRIRAEELRMQRREGEEVCKVEQEKRVVSDAQQSIEEQNSTLKKIVILRAVRWYLDDLETTCISGLKNHGILEIVTDNVVDEIRSDTLDLLSSSGAARDWVRDKLGI